MSKKFKGQRQWVREVLKKFDELEDDQPKAKGDETDWPDWVQNLLVGLMSLSHPGTKFRNMKNWKAKELGRFLGREYAGACLTRGEVPLSRQVLNEAKTFNAWAAHEAKRRSPNMDMDEVQRQIDYEIKERKPKFTKFVQEALSSAFERPYVETSAFFEAFGKAIVIKPDDFLTERTMGVGDKICWTIFAMWRDIERLESVAQLHRILEKALRPKGITIKYKRIEKLCQRIKLKFKERGRPPGSKNSDKSQVALGVF